MGIVFLAIATLVLLRHRHNPSAYFIISALFFAAVFISPSLLKPVYFFWMRLAYLLSWINTRLLLFVIFYFIFSPVGLILRFMRIDLLDRAIDKEKNTYWKRKEEASDYKRQF